MSFLFLRSRKNPRWNPIGSQEDRLDCSQLGQMGAFCEASWARWADERICTGDLPVASLGRLGSVGSGSWPVSSLARGHVLLREGAGCDMGGERTLGSLDPELCNESNGH